MSNMITDISVLFVRKNSIYKNLVSDCYDSERNALTFNKNCPIVAHPPCRTWSKLKGLCKAPPEEKQLAIWAVNQIRKNGGVLEHPAGSSLWKELNLPKGNSIDEYGGFTLCVDQHWFGHVAQKRTLLYIVGISPGQVPAYPLKFEIPTHIVSTSQRTPKGKRKECSKKLREYTPDQFAKFLIEIARLCAANTL